jgi:gamma-glutamyltranspeptidase/glutathione hydrolase
MYIEPIQGPKSVATGKHAMASTQHPIITKAILKVLKNGGNAFDAAISASILQCVIQPHMSCYSGTVDFLCWDESSGRAHYLNSVAEFPDGLSPFKPNPNSNLAAAVPGFMPGLATLANKFGTMPWSNYVQPAIEAAKKGVIMTSFMYSILANSRAFTYFPSARDFFYPNGFLVPVGARWKMPETAETLRHLSENGPDYFTKGAWAEHFVKKSNEIGWPITLKHLTLYEPRWIEPLRFNFQGYEMLGNPPPQMGGLTVSYFLGVLEEFNLKRLGHYSKSARTLVLAAQMFYRVWCELDPFIQDPLSYNVPSEIYQSKEYQRLVAEILRNSDPVVDLTENMRLRTNPASRVASGMLTTSEVNSCHNCIVDKEGNWITMMHTGNGGGVPGMVVDGVPSQGGSNNAVYAGPGRRIRSHINPILVLQDGSPYMVLGSPGDVAHNVPTVLLNIFGFGMDPYAAIDAPRFHPTPISTGALGAGGVVSVQGQRERWTLDIENRISNGVLNGLAKLGIEIKSLGKYNWHLGSMQLIWKEEKTGLLKGATDPRRLGHAEGF